MNQVASRTLATLRGLNIDDIDVQNEIDHMKNEDAYYKSVAEQITFVAICKLINITLIFYDEKKLGTYSYYMYLIIKMYHILFYTFLDKNKAWRRGFILCQILTICVAFNGTFGIVTYAWSIMKEAGVSFSPELLSLMVPLLMMSSAIVSMACVEKTGRKVNESTTFSRK